MELPYGTEFEQTLHYKGFDQKRINAFVFFNKHFCAFTSKEPYELNKQDMIDYLGYLIEHYGAKESTITMAVEALKAYYVAFRSIKIPALAKKTSSYKPTKQFPAEMLQSITQD